MHLSNFICIIEAMNGPTTIEPKTFLQPTFVPLLEMIMFYVKLKEILENVFILLFLSWFLKIITNTALLIFLMKANVDWFCSIW
jgi:hypothetical protein